MSESEQVPIPEWLDKLQNESWEAEILISGGAFVGLIAAITFFEPIVNTLNYNSNLAEGYQIVILGPLIFGWTLLTAGFFIHLILRGYWIGLIGLNSAFPKGINNERLSLKGRFSKWYKEPSNTPQILRLDLVCGTLFAFTFMSLFSILGITLYTALMVGLFSLGDFAGEESVLQEAIAVTFITLIVIGFLTLIDYLTLGRLKRIRWFAKVYYPLHYFMSIVTLSIVYRRLYYTLISNIKWRYIILFVAIQTFLITGLIIWVMNPTGISNSLLTKNFTDRKEKYQMLRMTEGTVVDKSLEVVLLHKVRNEVDMFNAWKEDNKTKSAESFEDLTWKEQVAMFERTYQIQIDSLPPGKIKWAYRNTRIGDTFISPSILHLRGRVDVSGLPTGPHDLKVIIGIRQSVRATDTLGFEAKGTFWIER